MSIVPRELGSWLVPGRFAETVLERAEQTDDIGELWSGALTSGGLAVKYKTLNAEKAELQTARMYLEVRLGQLLGPNPGAGGDQRQANQNFDSLPAADVHALRKFHGHYDWLVERVRAGVRNRHKLLVQLALHAQVVEREVSPDAYGALDMSDVPNSSFVTVVADPPWRYDNRGTRNAASQQYLTMSLDEIAVLPVGKKATEHAHLYLWTTNSFLRPAFDIIEAWDFTYKTCITWVKPQIGMGNYFRSASEHVLFATRGLLGTEVKNEPTWFKADKQKHSVKPDCFYDLVGRASVGPYLEMFARRRRMGDWSVWGDQA